MPEPRWLLLIHQIPPKPDYLRVKVWRRLQRLGAVALKSTVYVLPRNEVAAEDLEWVAREIVEIGGDASICEAAFVDGLTDARIEALFRAARDADYAQVAEDARALLREVPPAGRLTAEARGGLQVQFGKLQRKLESITAVDFFAARGREAADALCEKVAVRLRPQGKAARAPSSGDDPRGRTWVTRKGIHVDRMASAWLIRRFIDPRARFKFVAPKGYRPEAGELRFDMFEAEHTHEGDRCTFEVLLARFVPNDAALAALGALIHDIDLKDGKFARPETAGFESLIAGIALAHRDDVKRLERASAVLDELYGLFNSAPHGGTSNIRAKQSSRKKGTK